MATSVPGVVQQGSAGHLTAGNSCCFHCGLPVASDSMFEARIGQAMQSFCCPGCQAVAELIDSAGLDRYYRFYQPAGEAIDNDDRNRVYRVFDEPEFQAQFVHSRNQQEAAAELLLAGVHCAACVWLVEHFLARQPGVINAQLNFEQQRLTLQWNPQVVSLSHLCELLAKLGYPPQPFTVQQQQQLQQREYHQWLRRLGVAGIGMMQVGMYSVGLYAGDFQSIAENHRDLLRWTSLLITTVVVVYAAGPFFSNAWRGLKQKQPGMDLPVAVAVGLAYLASILATVTGEGEVYFDSIVMVTFLLLGGRFLEMRARHSSARVQQSLFNLLPEMVNCLDSDGQALLTPLYKLRAGDRIVIKPGEVIAVDGIITEGCSSVDESQLTGEFMPHTRQPGDRVVAGSVNGSSRLLVEVSAVGPDCQLAAIDSLLQQGREHKPGMAQFADRLARVFIVIVLILAALTWLVWQWLDPARAFPAMFAVLVVSCPCALSLAMPTVLTVATRRLRELGILVTRSHVWEQLADIDTVVCDKTGTLTLGRLTISAIRPVADWSAERCLQLAAALERDSTHPVARAFAHHAGPSTFRITDWHYHPGAGISAEVEGAHWRLGRAGFAAAAVTAPEQSGQWLLLSRDTAAVCWFRLEDELREDSAAFVAAMQQRQWPVQLLSGDHSDHVGSVASQLGIDCWQAGMTPAAKLAHIRQLQQQGKKVLMLGDGINDVPVLAAADVSIAMADASDLAKTQADCVLTSGRLMAVADLLALAATTRQRVRQNLFWALSYNLGAMPLAAIGLVPPWLAAVGMSLSSLLIVANALRLRRWQVVAPARLREVAVDG